CVLDAIGTSADLTAHPVRSPGRDPWRQSIGRGNGADPRPGLWSVSLQINADAYAAIPIRRVVISLDVAASTTNPAQGSGNRATAGLGYSPRPLNVRSSCSSALLRLNPISTRLECCSASIKRS